MEADRDRPQEWRSQEDPIWLPNTPEGPAVYVKGLAGGAWVAGAPRVYLNPGERTRAVDYQMAPLFEGAAGVEYRYRDFGVWGEVGYRHYGLKGGRTQFDIDGLGGVRVSLGMSWYGF